MCASHIRVFMYTGYKVLKTDLSNSPLIRTYKIFAIACRHNTRDRDSSEWRQSYQRYFK